MSSVSREHPDQQGTEPHSRSKCLSLATANGCQSSQKMSACRSREVGQCIIQKMRQARTPTRLNDKQNDTYQKTNLTLDVENVIEGGGHLMAIADCRITYRPAVCHTRIWTLFQDETISMYRARISRLEAEVNHYRAKLRQTTNEVARLRTLLTNTTASGVHEVGTETTLTENYVAILKRLQTTGSSPVKVLLTVKRFQRNFHKQRVILPCLIAGLAYSQVVELRVINCGTVIEEMQKALTTTARPRSPPGREYNTARRSVRRQVKRSICTDREVWWVQKPEKMEEARNSGNISKLFRLIRATGPKMLLLRQRSTLLLNHNRELVDQVSSSVKLMGIFKEEKQLLSEHAARLEKGLATLRGQLSKTIEDKTQECNDQMAHLAVSSANELDQLQSRLLQSETELVSAKTQLGHLENRVQEMERQLVKTKQEAQDVHDESQRKLEEASVSVTKANSQR
ncbi:ATP-binding cassette transporter [Clonorchis sinensis]|uniref:ATP-binding cassette transporter n=1 Tax=Clonorchis sinensis TaxID=79923 RepID=G7YV64_CLOSI|nr:ATP-binding cassette transporter [Clonorchis sinensis]